jgi:hypothetical protein
MSRQAAIVIGVDRVASGLTPLTAAASGASEVGNWLSRNDYDVDEVTDAVGPLTRVTIFNLVNRRVAQGNLERLVIYFAGHGFLKGPFDEYWLLSGAPLDAAEAINVSLSVNMARYQGIPQVIVISDACRVVPNNTVHANITGASIFPNLAPTDETAEIDIYYATRPGDPAHERKETEAQKAHGLFTAALLEAHKGAPPEALLRVEGRDYVRSRWLRRVLQDRVDDRAQSISLALTQRADVQLQIEDGYLGVNEPQPTPAKPTAGTAADPGLKMGRSVIRPASDVIPSDKNLFGLGTDGRQSPEGPSASPDQPRSTMPALVDGGASRDESFRNRVDTILEAQAASRRQARRSHGSLEFLRVHGEAVVDVASGVGGAKLIGTGRTGSVFRTPLGERAHGEIAIRFPDGTGMLLPVLREYRCDVIRRKGRTLSLSYTWLGSYDHRVEDFRAEVLSAATLGLLNLKPAAIAELADRIRREKRVDPVLGLVAVLAYTLVGDRKRARSVRRFMMRDNPVELFDSWLLGGGAAEREGGARPSVTTVPLLSQTWSFLDAFNSPLPEDLKRLPRVPGFWTVFEPEAVEVISMLARRPA